MAKKLLLVLVAAAVAVVAVKEFPDLVRELKIWSM